MKSRFCASALILFACMVNAGCKKTAVNGSGNNKAVPIHTAVGTPNGNPVTTTISSGGGKIISADSMVELQFPNGALSANTQITIQPITNNAPNGLGNAYRFLPDGLKFSTPLNLVFHYTDEQIAATSSDLMGIAFQDTSDIWHGLGSLTVDTINKTISAAINHFSDWAEFTVLYLTPPVNTELKISQSIPLTLKGIDWPSPNAVQGDELLAPLANTGKFLTITWLVNGVPNGNPTFGTITGAKFSDAGDLTATYTAPSKVPRSGNPVKVTARLKGIFNIMGGKDLKTMDVKTKILISNEKKYKIEILDYEPNTMAPGQTFSDAATINATLLINGTTSINKDNITNLPPSESPASVDFGACTYTWRPDPIGTLNVQSASIILTEKNNVDWIDMTLDNSGAQSQLFYVQCKDDPTHTITPMITGLPVFKLNFAFKLTDPETREGDPGGFQIKCTLLDK